MLFSDYVIWFEIMTWLVKHFVCLVYNLQRWHFLRSFISNQDIFSKMEYKVVWFYDEYCSFSALLHNNSTTIFSWTLHLFFFVCDHFISVAYTLFSLFLLCDCQLWLGQFLCRNIIYIWTWPHFVQTFMRSTRRNLKWIAPNAWNVRCFDWIWSINFTWFLICRFSHRRNKWFRCDWRCAQILDTSFI